MIFPHSLFDAMIHLIIHLAREVSIRGSVYYMYPFQRYIYDFNLFFWSIFLHMMLLVIILHYRIMFNMKSDVRNKDKSKGLMAEGYIIEECLSFI